MSGIDFVEERFGPVADAFADVLEFDDHLGSELAVYVDGRPVVSLHGGEDRASGRPYPGDALTRVASCSKGVTATAFGVLVDRGVIDPAALVSTYWPEYSTNGKEATTVEMVASHQAGLPFPPVGSALAGLDYFTSPTLVTLLASAKPLWEPGTAVAYHAATAGALLEEICFRASGRTLAAVLVEDIASPLSLDMWLGLPAQYLPRVVPGVFAEAFPNTMLGGATEGGYAEQRKLAIAETPALEPDFDDPEEVAQYYAASLPAVGVVTEADSLARMYAATIGEVDGVRLIGDETLAELTRSRTRGREMLIESGTAGPDLEFGFGYQLVTGSMPGFSPRSFGHSGMGGRLGLADTEIGVAFGFVCSSLRIIGPDGDPRWKPLLDATRKAVGDV